jgi:acyl transferase domain-containing protein
VAGVLSLEDALSLVAARGRLMQNLPRGSMLVVPLPEQKVESLIGERLSIAAINGPALCLVAGPTDAVDKLERELGEQGIGAHRIHTSHAFHSEMMDPGVRPFVELVKKTELMPPNIPYISNVTGTWIKPSQATDPHYWGEHLRRTVRFSEGVSELLKLPRVIMLEVGPGQGLSRIVIQHLNGATGATVFPSLRHRKDRQSDTGIFLNTLAKLWLTGAQVNWSKLSANEDARRIHLPTYPFERQRYWIESHRGRPPAQRSPEIITNDFETRLLASGGLQELRPGLGLAVFSNNANSGAVIAEHSQARQVVTRQLIVQQLEIMTKHLALLRNGNARK